MRSVPTAARRLGAVLAGAVVAALLVPAAPAAQAASSKGCDGGGFSLVSSSGRTLAAPGFKGTVPATELGSGFQVRGRYVTFGVTSASLGVTDWTFTGAPNPLSMVTDGKPLVVFAEKTPDHRGLTLTSGLTAELKDTDLVISRTGPGLAMKIQAKDCANGGIFQMEVERADGGRTVFTHRLAPDVFYYDNPRFRERIGTTVPFVTDTGETLQIPVTARVNFGSDRSSRLVGRDSAQVATRIGQCSNAFGTHCGGVSQWSVASGGRMGQVMGEDAVEVAPGATDCVEACQAQNRIRGRATVLGFPFPVPTESRLTPRFP